MMAGQGALEEAGGLAEHSRGVRPDACLPVPKSEILEELG